MPNTTGLPVTVADEGLVHVYTELGSALLDADKVAAGAAQVVVTDPAVPKVNEGVALSAITVNELAVLVAEETQPVKVFVTAKV